MKNNKKKTKIYYIEKNIFFTSKCLVTISKILSYIYAAGNPITILWVRLVREFWRGGAGRGGEIFNLKCLVQFLEGEGREGEGSKSF